MNKVHLKEFGWDIYVDTDAITYIGSIYEVERLENNRTIWYYKFKIVVGGSDQVFSARAVYYTAPGLFGKTTFYVNQNLVRLREFLISRMR